MKPRDSKTTVQSDALTLYSPMCNEHLSVNPTDSNTWHTRHCTWHCDHKHEQPSCRNTLAHLPQIALWIIQTEGQTDPVESTNCTANSAVGTDRPFSTTAVPSTGIQRTNMVWKTNSSHQVKNYSSAV